MGIVDSNSLASPRSVILVAVALRTGQRARRLEMGRQDKAQLELEGKVSNFCRNLTSCRACALRLKGLNMRIPSRGLHESTESAAGKGLEAPNAGLPPEGVVALLRTRLGSHPQPTLTPD